jgi:dCTP diphosphatase
VIVAIGHQAGQRAELVGAPIMPLDPPPPAGENRGCSARFARATEMPMPADTLESLRDAQRAFVAERDWDRFHTPKNLAAALAVEAAELLEPFQWLTAEESAQLSPAQLAAVQDEMADVLLYLVRLADRLDVDLLAAARAKIAKNALKYPVERSKGSARKYDEL